MRRRVKDKRVLALVKAFLKAGVLTEHGKAEDAYIGTPRGGILSPLLANIALGVLDEYVMAPWKPNAMMGTFYRRHARRAKGLPTWRIVRYADLCRLRHKPMPGTVADQDLGPQMPDQGAQVYRRYRAVLATEHGPRRGLQVTVDRDGGRKPLVAQWGGISLARDITPRPLNDNPSRVWSNRRSEVVQRLLADACEPCGSNQQVEVHHVRALEDLNPKGRKHPPEWVVRMAARRRKTLVVCRVGHEDIHAGRPTRQPQ